MRWFGSILLVLAVQLRPSDSTCSIVDFGGIGDGQHDNGPALTAAVNACLQRGDGHVLVPAGNFSIQPVAFDKNITNLRLSIEGLLFNGATPETLPSHAKAIITFHESRNVTIDAGISVRSASTGVVDGNGAAWWTIRRKTPSFFAPVLFLFHNTVGTLVRDLWVRNSPMFHLVHENAANGVMDGVLITAPADSPNTDGIDLSGSGFIVRNSRIDNGDDGVAIKPSCANVTITNNTFLHGHGASIGSIGENNGTGHIANVLVENNTFIDMQNVARIKTWQGGHGSVTNITYRHLRVQDSDHVIFITQYYCPSSQHSDPCKNYTDAVVISNIIFDDVTGTFQDSSPGQLLCSDTFPCSNVTLRDVNLQGNSKHYTWDCWQVHGQATNVTPPITCLDT
ncbi:uncharacterized protein MONBRDRAFT_8071 [Monosiga brevicollis MX1]|uniref:Uncharacterized protein n=1 Tax=Monosiga brevicollis TaxID=81824 RepID=A9UYY9_MONBE|nr:uncharacterized protein MONBRDRAFT_8071 [Monosiga brevicollis MX1]EDQ89542.1 predicted protein [Monosiga brevicollis MX1]|eukprot:XP_001745571.1 hypothetical protein [Monosiga brevicollis MX1]